MTEIVKIKNICNLIKRGITPKYTENNGVIVINQRCIRDGIIVYKNARKHDIANKKIPEDRKIIAGDVLINSTGVGTLGRVSQIYPFSEMTVDSHVTIVRANPSYVDLAYFGYYLKFLQPSFEASGEGSTGQTELARERIGEHEIRLPLKSEQIKIGKLLSYIDDLIQNNRRMNSTLEEMVRAIFKSWFVDFDPVHSKVAGNAPMHMDSETAALFPNTFGDDGLPVGWKTSKFEDLIEFKNGYAFKSKELSKDFKTNFAIFKMGHIKVGGGFNDTCKTDYLNSEVVPNMEKYILETGDILMSMTDMKDNVRLLGHTALFYEQNVKFLVNQRVGHIKAKKEITNYPYIYCLTNNKTFLNEIRKRANSGVQVNLSTDGIKTTPTIMPPLSLMAKFGSLSKPKFERIFNSFKENQTLAELRDILLPKLMSGEIQVKDAERKVEASL